MSIIKKKLSPIKFAIKRFTTKPNYYEESLKSQKKVILFLAADYGNLGDTAITYAQRKWLNAKFPDHTYIEIPKVETIAAAKGLKKVINQDDLITMVGGGNMGNMYIGFERLRRLVVSMFPNNRIVSFPQTIDFSDDAPGVKEFNKTAGVYSNHPELFLVAREEASYAAMKNIAPTRTLLTPDIVMSLDKSRAGVVRDLSTAIICMRNDQEASVGKTAGTDIFNVLSSHFSNVIRYDTHIGNVMLGREEGEGELDKIWDAFAGAGVVVTDRLHGMIFCAITGTPCVAMNNSNGKVSGVYNRWLQKFTYIQLAETYEIGEIEKKIELATTEYGRVAWSNFDAEFEPIARVLSK